MHRVTPFALALAAPSSAEQEQAEAYIHRLLECYALVRDEWIDFRCLSTTIACLYESNAYPLERPLAAVVRRAGLLEVTVNDVVSVVNALLARPFLEDQIGLREALWSELDISPEIGMVEVNEAFRGDAATVLGMVAASFALGLSSSGQHSIVTGVCDPRTEVFVVAGDLIAVDPGGDGGRGEIPAAVKVGVRAEYEVGSVLFSLDPLDLWCEGGAAAIRAVKLAWIKRKQQDDLATDWRDAPEVKFGDKFASTSESHGFLADRSKAERLIRAIVDVLILGRPPTSHFLRTGPGGADPTRMRGKDKALRQDIDYEYHLHYWETSEGPEFAAVVAHNDLSIPD